jgi:DNA polymerase I
MPPILYLLDGHALAYRTYFAISGSTSEQLKTQDGEPTAGVFGFASVILRLLEKERPEYLAVTFDGGHSFRDQIFTGYKATRAKMPEDLRPQMTRIRQLIDAFKFPRIELEGYEADDILGSLAKQAVEKGFGVKIITGDRDLLQLVDARVIVNLAGNKLSEAKDYMEKEVFEYLGVRPDQVVDYKALVGDKSDNIPGVMGIGEKTACSLLEKYGTLDEIYHHLDDLSKGVKTKLETGRENAYLSQKLATILTDLKVTLDLDAARVDFTDISEVDTIFRELEFRSLQTRLRNLPYAFSGMQPELVPAAGPGAQTAAPVASATGQLSLFGEEVTRIGISPSYQLDAKVVDTPEALQELVQALDQAQTIGFDTESTSTDPLRADLVGISLAVREGQGFYIPVGHLTGEKQLPIVQVIAALRPALTDPNKRKVGQNLKYDYLMLERYNLKANPLAFDTMLAEWLRDPATRNLGLKEMAEHYLDIAMTHIEELIGRGKTQRTMAEVAVAEVAPYAAADAEVVLKLIPILEKKMNEVGVTRLFQEIEMPLVCVLAGMEREGIGLDVPFLQTMSTDLAQRMVTIEQNIYTSCGYNFNINSTQQLSKVLFETLKLDPPDRRKKTASGHYSTSADVLEDLRGMHPVVDMVLEFRELAKLRSTYLEALPQQINPTTGRVHTSFSQTGSITGRLASSDPNLQNIPARSELGRQIRKAFIASPGNVLLSVDYSQIELRILAHMAGDEAMLNAFRQGQDIHATSVAAIFNTPIEKVTKDMRRLGKSINFGLVYGMSAFGLSRYSGVTLAEAENFVKAYFQKFPGVKRYLDGIRLLASRQGYVETLLGRRRYFPNLANPSTMNVNIRNREEREAINAPIQGTAADIMKLAMIRLQAVLAETGCPARLLLQVHDELVLETPLDSLKETTRIVQQEMEHAYELSIPLETEAKYGINWGAMEPIAH